MQALPDTSNIRQIHRPGDTITEQSLRQTHLVPASSEQKKCMFVYLLSLLVHGFPPDGDLDSSDRISRIASSFKMMTLSILKQDAHPPTASPLFTTLPTELRLNIYAFVFTGCQATVWFDAEFVEYPSGRKYLYERCQGDYRKRTARDGHCCFGHSGGGFGLLATCRMVYVEAFQTYWSQTALRGTRHIRTWNKGCELQQVCVHLPAAIKAKLGHLQNIELPKVEDDTQDDDDTNSAASLLRQFPRLVTCAFLGPPPLPNAREPPYISGLPDSENLDSTYQGVGPFVLKDGESPEAFLERRYGIQRSCCVIFLSTFTAFRPRNCPMGYKRRHQYFNYTTGMVYQTTTHPPFEDGFVEVMRAKEGSEWSSHRDED